MPREPTVRKRGPSPFFKGGTRLVRSLVDLVGSRFEAHAAYIA
ncbi:hypothetical protein [Lysobacter gummosus]